MSNPFRPPSPIRARMAVLAALVGGGMGIAAVLGPGASACRAVTRTYDVMLSGPNESPANASPGTGFAEITIDTTLSTLRVQMSFSGLLGTTTASHIHAATTVASSGTAIVATQTPTFTGFPLGVTAGSYDHTFDMTQAASYNPAFITADGGTVATAFAALVAAMDGSKAYLNIHSSVFPGGEIRGFPVLISGACCTGSTCTFTTGLACSAAPSPRHFTTATACNAAGNNTSPCCKADYDHSGGLAIADVFAFLNAWFAINPNADFDGVDGLQIADIFAFLNAWFAGCP